MTEKNENGFIKRASVSSFDQISKEDILLYDKTDDLENIEKASKEDSKTDAS